MSRDLKFVPETIYSVLFNTMKKVLVFTYDVSVRKAHKVLNIQPARSVSGHLNCKVLHIFLQVSQVGHGTALFVNEKLFAFRFVNLNRLGTDNWVQL